jgi:hypothetical protein
MKGIGKIKNKMEKGLSANGDQKKNKGPKLIWA